MPGGPGHPQSGDKQPLALGESPLCCFGKPIGRGDHAGGRRGPGGGPRGLSVSTGQNGGPGGWRSELNPWGSTPHHPGQGHLSPGGRLREAPEAPCTEVLPGRSGVVLPRMHLGGGWCAPLTRLDLGAVLPRTSPGPGAAPIPPCPVPSFQKLCLLNDPCRLPHSLRGAVLGGDVAGLAPSPSLPGEGLSRIRPDWEVRGQSAVSGGAA